MSLQILATMQRSTLVLAAAAIAVGGLAWGPRGMLAATAGAALAVGNLMVTRRLAAGAMRRAQSQDTGGLAVLMLGLTGKLGVLAVLVYVCIGVLGLAAAPFSVGLSVLVLGLLTSGLWSGLQEGAA